MCGHDAMLLQLLHRGGIELRAEHSHVESDLPDEISEVAESEPHHGVLKRLALDVG